MIDERRSPAPPVRAPSDYTRSEPAPGDAAPTQAPVRRSGSSRLRSLALGPSADPRWARPLLLWVLLAAAAVLYLIDL